jgi:metal-dependent amidase/aminoacylase/carboxypeptidase family protein
MNAEFYENDAIEDALFDLFVDQLHQFAEMELEDEQTTAWVSSSADRATAF